MFEQLFAVGMIEFGVHGVGMIRFRVHGVGAGSRGWVKSLGMKGLIMKG